MTTTPTLWGSEKIIATGNPGVANVAALDDNTFVFVWDEAGTGRDIAGARYTDLGVLVPGSDFVAFQSNFDGNNLKTPDVVQGADGFLYIPYVREISPTNNDIRYAVSATFAASGDQGIDTSGTDSFFVSGAASRISGGAAFLWQTPGSAAVADDDLILGFVKSNGPPDAIPFINIDTSAGQSQQNASLTSLANGNLVVAYENFNFNGGNSIRDIRYRVFDSNGNDIETETIVSQSSGNAVTGGGFASVTGLSNGNFVIVYQQNGHISYSLFNNSGAALTGRLTYSDPGIIPVVTGLNDGGFIIGWANFAGIESDGSREGQIVLQRFDADGGIVGNQLRLGNRGDQFLSDLATLSDGRVVVSYDTETGAATNVTQAAFQIIDPRDAFIEGDNENNNIVGRLGDSNLAGLEGNDRLTALGGDDTAQGGHGNDTVTGGGGDDWLAGGSGHDQLLGQDGDDSIGGGSGHDKLAGGAGDDLFHGNAGNETINGGIGDDTLFGEGGNDTLLAEAGADELRGGAGNDRLNGGLGQDSQWGGVGADVFDYDSTVESGVNAVTRDILYDFVKGQDRIDMSTIDARRGTAGNQAFAFIGNAAFSAEGQISAVILGGDMLLSANTLGAAGAEWTVLVKGLVNFAASDFFL